MYAIRLMEINVYGAYYGKLSVYQPALLVQMSHL